MKKYKEKFRYLDARLKISFVVVCILSFLLVLCLDREWIFPEGFWKIAMIFLPLLLVGFTYLWIWKPYRRLINQVQRFSDGKTESKGLGGLGGSLGATEPSGGLGLNIDIDRKSTRLNSSHRN